jgi:hypothetical protein
VRFDVPTLKAMKVTVFWDVTLYSVVDHYQYFGVEEKVAGSSKT